MGLEEEERRKLYSAFADATRKWVSAMDAKAAFLSALDGALITFIWTGARLTHPNSGPSEALGVAATAFALLSLIFALWAIAPRQSLNALFGRSIEWSGYYRPYSFYAFLATRYKPADFDTLLAEVNNLEEADFAEEALEQHFTISHTVYNKSLWVTRSSLISMLAIVLTVFGLLAK